MCRLIILLLTCVLLASSGSVVAMDTNWTFLPLLQDLCPYTSFCELNPDSIIPKNYTRRPCCHSCSCQSGCEEYDNCCFDSVKKGRTQPSVKCTSPVVSSSKIRTTYYTMTYSCASETNSSICVVDLTDYKSFAPVTSNLSGTIYVNAECALCNNVQNVIPWDLAIKCPIRSGDHSFDTVRLLQGEDIGETACHMVYIPTKDVLNVEARECTPDTIRECNVTGRMTKREPWWDNCPMFNATYTPDGHTYFGNIFCYSCNTDVKRRCEGGYDRREITSPLIAILDGTLFTVFMANRDNEIIKRCSPQDTLKQAIQSKCHRKVCSTGKIQIGTQCGFYSKEWIGGPFTAVLKLTPVGKARLDPTILSNIPPEIQHDSKATWLTRNAMKRWNIKTLYKPSKDEQFIDYLVAFSSYPGTKVDPSKLETILRRTLKETWQIKTSTNVTVPLHVEFNSHEHYMRLSKTVLESRGFRSTTANEFIFLTGYSYAVSITDLIYMLPFHYPGSKVDFVDGLEGMVLNELFLCEQFELYPHEYEIRSSGRSLEGDVKLLIPDLNITLYPSQYRLIDSDSVSVCRNKIIESRGLNLESGYLYCIVILFLGIYCIC